MIRINLFFMTIIWVSCTFSFYMLAYKVKYFPGSLNMNQAASLIAEATAYISVGFLATKYRAKPLFTVFFSMSAVSGLLIILTGSNANAIFVILVLLAKFGVSAAFGLVYIAHPKMFPTLFSVSSMGIVNFISRLVTIAAPMIAEIAFPVPMLIFTAMCVISAISAFFLIESN